ncbi:MAG: class I SAM-dependent methyltransferase [Lachnospiraceae bacterium]
MQLSQRLLAVADLASAGHCLADVGTDHGYIPIYLMEKGNYERAIAMDVRKGPLLRAEENRKSHGFEDRMDLRLSDGVAALREGEADTVVIAGMGGGLVIHILTEGAKVLKSVETLVLQPQSEFARVRDYLEKNEYRIEEEHMLCEDGKYYAMMRVKHGKMTPLTEIEQKYGPVLLAKKGSGFEGISGKRRTKNLRRFGSIWLRWKERKPLFGKRSGEGTGRHSCSKRKVGLKNE